jgi:predicted transcriptional regulator
MSATTEIRDAVFSEHLPQLRQVQAAVHAALLVHGPCTTRQLAERCGITIFTVRPRVCELVDLGMAELSGKSGREGMYRALTAKEAEALLTWEAAAISPATQRELL